jgi:hypothetical protein
MKVKMRIFMLKAGYGNLLVFVNGILNKMIKPILPVVLKLLMIIF